MYYVTLRVGDVWRQPAKKLIIIKEIREESRYNIYRKQYYTEKNDVDNLHYIWDHGRVRRV